MTPDEFAIKLDKMSVEINAVVNNALPIIIGKKAVDFFKEGFQKEGFTDTATVAWQEVKRRQNPKTKGAAATRKILTGETGDLGESIQYTPGTAEVKIHSDLPYADAHNSGTTTAGRNHNVTIPARPFIKESAELEAVIAEEIERKLGDIFK